MKSTVQIRERMPLAAPLKSLLTIERDSRIRFHELGTLASVTRWVSSHDEGIAEWLKNVRRAYQSDRSDVAEKHRAALLLLQDAEGKTPGRIGLLDTGGASLADVTAWSTWQDPGASGRGSPIVQEETQGNGGKAYMYRLFSGPCRILGVKENKLNCKGFEGAANSLERGIPGFIPNSAAGCNLPSVSWKVELGGALKPYRLALDDLPAELQRALRARKAFTLVEAVDPIGFFKRRMDSPDLVSKILRHDQSALAVQQFRLYAVHNGRLLNGGKFLELEEVPPYPGFDQPVVSEIPESLPDASGTKLSTTLDGMRSRGRLILYTSRENMPNAHRKLKPRWKVSYCTSQQMIGSKAISDLALNTPGAQYIYATAELDALEPDYVELGRKRPIDGPLMEALDIFIAEGIRGLAKSINESRRHHMDQQALAEVSEENRVLNQFKNRFLPGSGSEGGNSGETVRFGPLPVRNLTVGAARTGGAAPHAVELCWRDGERACLGRGVVLPIETIAKSKVVDSMGKALESTGLRWHSADPGVVRFGEQNMLAAVSKGATEIWTSLTDNTIESPRIPVEVWAVDHVLLKPRSIEIPLGRRKRLVAEVTNDERSRSTNVFLNWKHDASDQLIVRMQPGGWVIGNRIGATAITAGAGDRDDGGVWARIPMEVSVIAVPDEPRRGSGYPELRLTDRDIDPAPERFARAIPSSLLCGRRFPITRTICGG